MLTASCLPLLFSYVCNFWNWRCNGDLFLV